MTNTVTIEADSVTTGTTNINGSVDVFVTVAINGEEFSGEVTLCLDVYTGMFASWGSDDHWIEGALLAAIRAELDGMDYAQCLRDLATVAGKVADRAVDSGDVVPEVFTS